MNFVGCNSLENIDLSGGFLSQDDYTVSDFSFMSSNNLKSVSLPEGLPLKLKNENVLQNMIFLNCTSLETIKAPEELREAEWLKEIGDGVEIIYY